MNRRVSTLLAALGLTVLGAAAPASAQKFWKDVPIPAMREFQIPKPEVYTLKNGLRVFLLEDHTLPRVRASMLVRTGSVWEPADKAGLAGITGAAMRTGGSVNSKGEQIDELLEGLGASVETRIDNDSATATMFTLSRDVEVGLDVLADVVQHPAFPEDKIELAKLQARDTIARRNDEVADIAEREFRKLTYGTDSPYARQTEYATLDAIHREDLVAFHRAAFRPDNAMLGIVGDFQPSEIKKLVQKGFGDWKAEGKAHKFEMPPAQTPPGNALNTIVKDDVAQAQIRIGHLGGRRDDPDYPALLVMTEIFGSGAFSSRLFNEVRTKRGLAYFAYGAWQADYESPGTFVMSSATKNETIVETVKVMVDTLRTLLQEAPSDAELSQAKDSLLNSLVFVVDTRVKILNRQMNYAYHGYPTDFLQRVQKAIEAVTAEDVLRVAKSHLRPDALVYLVAGKISATQQPLRTLGLGGPKSIDISIPPPAPATTPGQAPPTASEGHR